MARKRSSRSRPTAYRSPIASSRLARPVFRLRPWSPVSLRVFEDRRTWVPRPFLRPPLTLGRRDARRVVVDRAPRGQVVLTPGREVHRFADPRRVVLCVRRKERREVLFANKLTRSGRGGRKRRNEWSVISCR